MFCRVLTIMLTVTGALASPPAVDAQEVSLVHVTNLPAVQQVAGEVLINRPVPHSKQVSFADVVVNHVDRNDTSNLVSAGVIDASGYTSFTLAFAGEIRGTVPGAAEVGVLLLPDEELVDDAFDEGHILFPVELTTTVKANAPAYLHAQPTRVTVAFPKYQVYLFNTGVRTVSVTVYAMLAN